MEGWKDGRMELENGHSARYGVLCVCWDWRGDDMEFTLEYGYVLSNPNQGICSQLTDLSNRINLPIEHTSSTRITDICGIMVRLILTLISYQVNALLIRIIGFATIRSAGNAAITFIVKALQVHPNELYHRLQNISFTVDP
jgi:hypothetical protein